MPTGPYVARITRVSPPELAREFPGPQASSSVTLAPFRRSWSADQPPNAPAPTTIAGPRNEAANAGEPAMQAAPAMAEVFRKLRRERLVSMLALPKSRFGGVTSFHPHLKDKREKSPHLVHYHGFKSRRWPSLICLPTSFQLQFSRFFLSPSRITVPKFQPSTYNLQLRLLHPGRLSRDILMFYSSIRMIAKYVLDTCCSFVL